ncbi:MAG: glycosyltransferase [Bacteroidales bacterium]
MTEVIIWTFTIIIAALYFFQISAFTIGWFSIKNNNYTNKIDKIPASVIIAARNEEQNIINCLKCLAVQNYPKEKFEVIIVDDHSTDMTAKLINNFIKKNKLTNFKYVKNNNKQQGKKSAITEGIKYSSGDIITTTDADCTMHPEWLNTICGYFNNDKTIMVLGPVCLTAKSIFSKMQALEFNSLIGITGGSAALKEPVLANGANLSFRKYVFTKFDGYKTGLKYASGDDVFFLQQAKRIKNKNIVFAKDYNASVFTKPKANIKDFIKQRMRWAGKTKGFTDFFTLLVAGIAFLNSLSIFTLALLFAFGAQWFLMPLLLIASSKFIIDLPLLSGVSNFFKRPALMFYYPPVFVLYPFYIVTTAIGSFFYKPEWK